ERPYETIKYLPTLFDDRNAFAKNYRARGIRVMSEGDPVLVPLPIEVAGLFSSYFFSLFYGGYKDGENRWVEVHDVDPTTIFKIVVETVHRYSINITKFNWECTAKVLEHCDRFCFEPQFRNFLRSIMAYIRKGGDTEEDFIEGLQELSQLLRVNDLMRTFVENFCLPESLEEWERKHADEITYPEFAKVISERKAELREICKKRPEWRINFSGGIIVCSLLDDMHPVLIRSFVQHLRSQDRHVHIQNTLPKVFAFDRLAKDDRRAVPIFENPAEAPQPCNLMYFDFVTCPYVRICGRIYSSGWLLGVVTEGAQLLPGNCGFFNHYEVEERPSACPKIRDQSSV
ncbi:hypothetical protein PMAYCL1PPCAC_13762, partial [Pristionchus mayeri]